MLCTTTAQQCHIRLMFFAFACRLDYRVNATRVRPRPCDRTTMLVLVDGGSARSNRQSRGRFRAFLFSRFLPAVYHRFFFRSRRLYRQSRTLRVAGPRPVDVLMASPVFQFFGSSGRWLDRLNGRFVHIHFFRATFSQQNSGAGNKIQIIAINDVPRKLAANDR